MSAPGFSILLTPLRGATLRWKGEFGPTERGPRAYAQSLLLPLPSTILGALAAAVMARTGRRVDCNGGEPEPCGLAAKILQEEIGKMVPRGPFFYTRGKHGYAVCVVHGRQEFYCAALRNGEAVGVGPVEPPKTSMVGIALSDTSKTVIEHMIYSMDKIYYESLAYKVSEKASIGSPQRYGVLVEAYPKETSARTRAEKLLQGSIVGLGTKSSAARIEVLDETPVLALAEAAEQQEHELRLHIASPIILKPEETRYSTLPGDYLVQIAPLIADEIDYRELEELIKQGKLATPRIVFTVLGLGYSLCEARRRAYYPAIMPGTALTPLSTTNWRKVYLESRGFCRECIWKCIWGTIAPLPRSEEEEED